MTHIPSPYYGGGQVPRPANVVESHGAPSVNAATVGGIIDLDVLNSNAYMSIKPGVWVELGGVAGPVDQLSGDNLGSATPLAGVVTIAGTANQISTSAGANSVTLSLPVAITAPGSLTTTTTLTGGTGVTATTGNVVATAGQVNAGTTMTAGTGITSTTGDIVATAGAVNAGTTMTAGTGITSTTGDIVATAGAVNAGTTVTAGTGITSTTGDIVATAGALSAGTTVTGGTGVTATTGDVVATAGAVSAGTTVTGGTGVVATTGDITASAGNVAAVGNLSAIKSAAGANITAQITNSDNTNGASNAGVEIATGGASSGDPYLSFQISGVGASTMTMGLDNSASDLFVISNSAAIGTSNALTLSQAGALTASTSITATAGDITATLGNMIINGAAKQLRVHGGAATDFIGTTTLTNGVSPAIANTNIAAADVVLVSRYDANGATGIGSFVVTIVPNTSIQITSLKSDASTETNDQSKVAYFIVRQV